MVMPVWGEVREVWGEGGVVIVLGVTIGWRTIITPTMSGRQLYVNIWTRVTS